MAEEFIPMDSVAEVSLCIVRGGYYSAQSIIAFFFVAFVCPTVGIHVTLLDAP